MNINQAALMSRSRKLCHGMTLPEVMVALGIGSIILTVVATLSLYSSRTFVAMGNYVDLDKSSRNALDLMIREIRQTTVLSDYKPNSLTFVDSDGLLLQYEYDSTARTLSRRKPGEKTIVLLTECDYLNFYIFQRSPLPGAKFVSTTSPASCKLVDMTWKCSRTILGKKLNTESVQTAKIVIRNKR